MKRVVSITLFAIGMMLSFYSCSSDTDNTVADDITISEPFAQAEDNALSLDQLPEWIAEKITKAEETGVDDPYMMFSVYQCIWNGDLYYFIYSPLKSCIYCDSVFYPDGQVIEWEDSEQIHAFVEESIDWKLIYGLDRGKKQ